MSAKQVKWFARGGGIAKCGPFRSQVEATAAMRQVAETEEQYAYVVAMHGAFRPRYKGGFPEDIFVWPEHV